MDTQKIIDQINELVVTYGQKIIGAILVLIIGLWIIKMLNRGFGKLLDKGNTTESLSPFLKGIVSVLLKILLGISILGMLGIEMTSFIALLGSVGLAFGLALSGTLQNFAGGVMILLFKPFKVGDFIEAEGYTGTVSEIQVFHTFLKTVDNKTIIIPNGGLSNASMTNYSSEELRRVDWKFGIAYGDDVDQARSIIKKLSDSDVRILKDPEVFIAISELGDSSVNFAVRAWVKASDYWPVFFEMNENIYKTFNSEGVNIPFPQMDVHLYKK